MAISEQKRQQKLARKKAKRKKSKVPAAFSSLPAKLSSLANAPIHKCLVPQNLFELGLGNIILSRRFADGNIAMAVFLVDVFCLGVKNAFITITDEDDFDDKIDNMRNEAEFKTTHPSYARKLIETAVDYAHSIGFEPHSDYKSAQRVFNGIDAAACAEQFQMGKDGMPFYISGPSDSMARRQLIINTLTRTCGPNCFHYAVGVEDEI